MNLVFEKEKLWAVMQVLVNIVDSRKILPILANVLIRAADDQIQLATTDLEVGVKCVVPGQIIEPGSITLPAKKLADIVREIPSTTSSGGPAEIKLTKVANDRVDIHCEKAKFRIIGLPDDEFPSLPELGDSFLTLNSNILSSMIQKTAFAVSTEHARYFLNGIYFSITSDTIKMVATDGKRLAVASHKQADSVAKEIGVIIPIKAVKSILKTFTSGENIKIAPLENQIVFATQTMTLVSRLIEGEYPDYQAVMAPAMSNEIKLVVGTKYLSSVVKRVALLANPKTPTVRMVSNETGFVISSSTPDFGEAQEQMQVMVVGGSIDIAFNARFVMDVLQNIESNKILFKFRDNVSAVLITPAEEDNYMSIIMPITKRSKEGDV